MDEESSVRVQLTSRLGCLVKKSLWGPAPRARGHRDDTGTYAVLQDKGDTDARRSGPGWRPVAGVHGCLVTHSGRGPAGPALRQHPTWGRPARAGQWGSLRGPGPAGRRFRPAGPAAAGIPAAQPGTARPGPAWLRLRAAGLSASRRVRAARLRTAGLHPAGLHPAGRRVRPAGLRLRPAGLPAARLWAAGLRPVRLWPAGL